MNARGAPRSTARLFVLYPSGQRMRSGCKKIQRLGLFLGKLERRKFSADCFGQAKDKRLARAGAASYACGNDGFQHLPPAANIIFCNPLGEPQHGGVKQRLLVKHGDDVLQTPTT